MSLDPVKASQKARSRGRRCLILLYVVGVYWLPAFLFIGDLATQLTQNVDDRPAPQPTSQPGRQELAKDPGRQAPVSQRTPRARHDKAVHPPAKGSESRAPAPQQEARVQPYEAPRRTGRGMTGRDGAPMVLVPAGEFLYGDSNQRLSLPAFSMDKFEVTTKLYAAFMQATGRAAPGRWNEANQVSDGDRPVIGVTWHDADAYCRYYGKRLPTEQEWEKAARGTDGRKYPWGNEAPTSRHANYGKCCDWQGYGATLASVESYEAGKSPYGLYHMAGNVWEWTNSDYDSSQKVFRGGSWSSYAIYLEAPLRDGWTPGSRYDYLGFRCVQDAQ